MPPVGIVVDLVSGLAFLALAAFVASVASSRRENRLFAAFGAGFGVHFAALNATLVRSWGAPLDATLLLVSGVSGGVAAVALVGLASRAPWTMDAAERARIGRLRTLPGAVIAIYLLAFGLTIFVWLRRLAVEGRIVDVTGVDRGSAPLAAALLGQVAIRAAMLSLGALLALRYAALPEEARSRRRQLATLYVALTLYPLLNAGADLGFVRAGFPALTVLTELAVAVVIAALWLRASRGPGSRTARELAWVTLAVPLVGMAAVAAARGDVVTTSGLMGVSRMAGVGVLAYAILRHQILGIDVKLRWGVSRSTVAAVFVAAFFIASEGAQILFGQGNEWLGLFAAGALVFAIAPLQRAAERLAERAVPVATPPARPEGGEPTIARGEASYRKAVRLALRDRTITRAEEGHLHELARDLGLDGARAHAIIVEVEAEGAHGGAAR